MEKDITTEEKIKEVARRLFHQKGFGMTRTRDIAEEAGINIALLNYYFRSKERLFEIIMSESFHKLIQFLTEIINNQKLSLSEILDKVVNKYIDLLTENPHLPLFVLSQMQANPEKFIEKSGFPKDMIKNSRLFALLKEQLEKSGMADINPIHIILNVVSITIFPFVGKPMLQSVFGMDNEDYSLFIEERRKLIPAEIKLFLKLDA